MWRGKPVFVRNRTPKEIEEAIDALEGVEESAVIGVPHPDMGEGVVAVVVGSGVSEEGILAAISGQLARFKQPRRVIVAVPFSVLREIDIPDLDSVTETLRTVLPDRGLRIVHPQVRDLAINKHCEDRFRRDLITILDKAGRISSLYMKVNDEQFVELIPVETIELVRQTRLVIQSSEVSTIRSRSALVITRSGT